MRRGTAIALFMGAMALAAASPAGAQPDPVAVADEKFRAGNDALDRGEYAEAARLFAEADRLAPHPVTLTSAIEAAVAARDAALAMELATEAAKRPSTPDLDAAADAARDAFAKETGRVTVVCPAPPAGATPEPCNAAIDGVAREVGAPIWLVVGDHDVLVKRGVLSRSVKIVVPPGASLEVSGPELPAPPPPMAVTPARASEPPPPETPSTTRVSPWWFGGALAITAGLGGGTIASALDTKSRYDDYVVTGLGAAEGEAAELRTNILFGLTLGGAATTVALAVLGFLPVERPSAVVSLAPVEGGVTMALGGAF